MKDVYFVGGGWGGGGGGGGGGAAPANQLLEDEGPHVYTVAVQDKQLLLSGELLLCHSGLPVAGNFTPQLADCCGVAAEAVKEGLAQLGTRVSCKRRLNSDSHPSFYTRLRHSGPGQTCQKRAEFSLLNSMQWVATND